MDLFRRVCTKIKQFCRSVIEWRSPFTVPYIFVINCIFWSIVYYCNHQTQIECLLGVSGIIILWDILLSPTHNHSVAILIFRWPIQDLFRTTAFLTAMAAVRQLKINEAEQAFWLASISSLSLIVGPVYKYNKITTKILGFLRGVFDCISYIVYLIIINPLEKLYCGLKYIFLLKWVPELWKYLHSFGSYLYKKIDDYFLQYIKSMSNKTIEFLKYWIYFYWWLDLKLWSYRNIYIPLAKKLTRLKDGFVYIFGGYWFYPALQFFGKQIKKLSIVILGWANQVMIAFGNSVLYPIAVVAFEQLKEGYLIFHGLAIQPVINIVYDKYKYVEDLAFIHIFGPVCQKLIDNVPEKNPFIGDCDNELKEFIPDLPSQPASDSEFSTLDNETDDEFAISLKAIDITASESDDDEFSLIPRRRRKIRPN